MVRFLKEARNIITKRTQDRVLIEFISKNFESIVKLRYSAYFDDYRSKINIPTSGGTLSITKTLSNDMRIWFKVEFEGVTLAKWEEIGHIGGRYNSRYSNIFTLHKFTRDMMDSFYKYVSRKKERENEENERLRKSR